MIATVDVSAPPPAPWHGLGENSTDHPAERDSMDAAVRVMSLSSVRSPTRAVAVVCVIECTEQAPR